MINHYENIRPDRIDDSIRMLRIYIKDFDIEPIIIILEALKPSAKNDKDKVMKQLREKLLDLGPEQGAVLTYAPYVALMMSDDPFDNGL